MDVQTRSPHPVPGRHGQDGKSGRIPALDRRSIARFDASRRKLRYRGLEFVEHVAAPLQPRLAISLSVFAAVCRRISRSAGRT